MRFFEMPGKRLRSLEHVKMAKFACFGVPQRPSRSDRFERCELTNRWPFCHLVGSFGELSVDGDFSYEAGVIDGLVMLWSLIRDELIKRRLQMTHPR